MKLVKISNDFFTLCKNYNVADELLYNENGRPSVLIVKLMYKGKNRKFVVPLRSNISQKTPKWQYFSLPPNKNTKQNHFHGIHYIKLFPIKNNYVMSYNIDKKFDLLVKEIIDNNEKIIIDCCQKYLNKCENGNKHNMTPNIDKIIELMECNKL